MGEMIQILSELPQDARLYTYGYEGGLNDAPKPTKVKVVHNVNSEWYYGPHEQDESGLEGYAL